MAAKEYVYGVKRPARVGNQYKWTAIKVKIKKIIKEELHKTLKEQKMSVDNIDRFVATIEEGDEVFQSPEQEDCDQWASLIAVAKALKMRGRAIKALQDEAAAAGCSDVLGENDGFGAGGVVNENFKRFLKT